MTGSLIPSAKFNEFFESRANGITLEYCVKESAKQLPSNDEGIPRAQKRIWFTGKELISPTSLESGLSLEQIFPNNLNI